MRSDPERLEFEIEARDGAARTGRLLTAHGPVATPAFIPLATRGAVRSLDLGDVAGLGFELSSATRSTSSSRPGAERIAELGGLHRFMGWDRAIITDSGGFQVFSLAHGNVADEIKGRRGGSGSSGGVLEISERGVRVPLLPRRRRSGSWGRRSRWRSRPRSAPTSRSPSTSARPYHADRDYTGALDRAHPSLARSLPRLARARGPRAPGACSGSSRAASTRTCAASPREAVAAAAVDGLAIGGTLGRDKPEMHGVLEMTVPMLPAEAPKHLLGIGEPDDLLAGIALGIDVFDCAVPTRLARHGMALAPLPDGALSLRRHQRGLRDATRPRWSTAARARPAPPTPAPTCTTWPRAEPPTAARLLTLHNLTFLERLVAGAREAIAAGASARYRGGRCSAAGRAVGARPGG